MATDDADTSDSGQLAGDESAESPPEGGNSASEATQGAHATVGEYTWADFMREHGHGDDVDTLYPDGTGGGGGLLGRGGSGPEKPSGDDWDDVAFDPGEYLGFDPDDVESKLAEAAGGTAQQLQEAFERRVDPEKVPVRKDWYNWEHFKHEYYYDKNGEPPTKRGSVKPFEPEEYLGWDPDDTGAVLSGVGDVGDQLASVVEDRTVTTMGELTEADLQAIDDIDGEDVEAFDEDAFFTNEDGSTTVVNRYDLEKTVPLEKKAHFREEDRYWVNKPYAFVVIFHSVKENEKKYYVVEPHQNEIEEDLKEYMTGKLRTAIKYSDDEVVVEGDEGDRAQVIDREARRLLGRYGLFDRPADDDGESGGGLLASLGLDELFGGGEEDAGSATAGTELEGLSVRPEPIVLDEDPQTLNEYQVEKLLYYLKRDFIGYERIDPIKQDTVNVEDVSCDGYNAPVFVYHSDYEQIITNVYHGEDELDDFVVKLAQRSGKGISKRNPQVDATLPDGSRSQLTLGAEVSDHGTNYTIRQFKEIPFTPIDQINWNTMSLDEVAYLWLAIENHKSMIIAGGTATGKTTLLNALSLFIPSNAKIVSIEDTREVELPQRNWVASVTRPSFGEDDTGDVDEFDLLEAALRQRPDYIVMGEVRGEEGRDLFQVMSTGHTSYSTFHADSVGEVLKRFTTDPINVSKTMFTALDLVAIQSRTRVGGHSVVRNKNLTEINHYDAENDEINVQDVYQWQAETDEFLKMGDSNTLEGIMFDRGWTHDKLQQELFKREVILAYLIRNELNTYTEVAATVQAFINDPETILTLVANGRLEESLEDLREMESVLIEVDEEDEELVPRPEPGDEITELCQDILDRAEDSLFDEYRGEDAGGVVGALDEGGAEPDRMELPETDDEEEIEFSGELREDAFDGTDLDVDDEDQPLGIPEGDSPASGGDGAAAATDAGTSGDAGGAAEASEPAPDAADEETGDGDSPDWLFGEEEAADDDSEDLDFGFEGDGDDGGGDDGGGDDGGGLAFGESEPDDAGESDDDGGFAFDDDEESGGLAFGSGGATTGEGEGDD